MAAPQNFRSALNGFNREDVVRYIEYLNARHTSEINQLHAELDLLQTRAAAPAAQLDALRAECQQLRQELAASEAALAEAQERCLELETRPAAAEQVENPLNLQLEQRCAALEAQLREAEAARHKAEAERDIARTSASASRVEQELEAYRRAERTERVARERAEQVYHQVNGVLSDASAKVDEAYTQIGDLTDRVSVQLAQLQEAVTGSRQALTDAAATLYAIRPTGENS